MRPARPQAGRPRFGAAYSADRSGSQGSQEPEGLPIRRQRSQAASGRQRAPRAWRCGRGRGRRVPRSPRPWGGSLGEFLPGSPASESAGRSASRGAAPDWTLTATPTPIRLCPRWGSRVQAMRKRSPPRGEQALVWGLSARGALAQNGGSGHQLRPGGGGPAKESGSEATVGTLQKGLFPPSRVGTARTVYIPAGFARSSLSQRLRPSCPSSQP